MPRPSTRTDVELLAAAPADADAFAEFYRRHERAVLGFFVHWCRSGELAADLMAETFAAAFEARSRYRAELGEPRAWLFGIARHVLLRSIRHGRVEDETRRRLGIARLVIDDDALERVEALASQSDAAVDALPQAARSRPARSTPSARTLASIPPPSLPTMNGRTGEDGLSGRAAVPGGRRDWSPSPW